jgi:hypothetical protein
LTLTPSITSLKRLLSCSFPGPTTRLMGFLGHSYMDLRPLNPPVSIVSYKLPPLPAFTVVLSTAILSRLSFPVEYPMAIRASRILDHTPLTLLKPIPAGLV